VANVVDESDDTRDGDDTHRRALPDDERDDGNDEERISFASKSTPKPFDDDDDADVERRGG